MKNQIRNLDLWLRSIHRSIVWKRISKRRLASVSDFDLSAAQKAEIRRFYKRYRIFPPPHDFRFYGAKTGMFDVRFIPDYLYYSKIALALNDRIKAEYLDDKNIYDLLFHDVSRPQTIIRKANGCYMDDQYRLISQDTAVGLCERYDSVIIKKSRDSFGGKNILIGSIAEAEMQEYLRSENNLIVQPLVRQHEVLASLHSQSLNTVRLVTLLFDHEVHFLHGVIRMGVGGSKVDNLSSGGIVCGINPDGSLKKHAFSERGEVFERHPTTGTVFEHITIPRYSEMCSLVKRLHPRLPDFGVLSWDIALDHDDQIQLIEVNMSSGTIELCQIADGPMFGDLTHRILDKVFNGR